MEITVTTSIVLAAGVCIVIAILVMIMAKFGAIASGLLTLALLGFAAAYIWYSVDEAGHDDQDVVDTFHARDSSAAQLMVQHGETNSSENSSISSEESIEGSIEGSSEGSIEGSSEGSSEGSIEGSSELDELDQPLDSEDSVQRYVYAALPATGNSRITTDMVPLPRAELSKTLAPSTSITAYRRAMAHRSNRFDGINERPKEGAPATDVHWKHKATTNFYCHNC